MNMGIIIIIAIIALWGLGVFLGAIGGFSKTFSKPPQTMDSSEIKSQEEQSIQETEEKRQQVMDDMKQKMEDRNH